MNDTMIYNIFLELHVTVSDTASISIKCLTDKNSEFFHNFQSFRIIPRIIDINEMFQVSFTLFVKEVLYFYIGLSI